MKFTPRVLQAFDRAERVVAEYGQEAIGTEHLLLSLLQDEKSVASQVADHLGARDRIVSEIDRILRSDQYNRPSRVLPADEV